VNSDNNPFSNQWHSLPDGLEECPNTAEYDRFHIRYEGGQSQPMLQLDWNNAADYYSEPKCFSNINLTIDQCSGLSVNECTSTFYVEPPYMSPESDNDCPHTSRSVREDLRAKNQAAAMEKLECIDKNWSNFVLASTSIKSVETVKAQQYLDAVNVVSTKDQELKDYYTAKIATIEGGLGKAVAAIPLEEELDYWLEEHEQSSRKLLAEAASASQLGRSYRRHSAQPKNQRTIAAAVSPQLICYPNPNSGEFQLTFSEEIRNQSLNIQLFNITGHLVSEDVVDCGGKSININVEQSGIFIVKVLLENGAKMSTRVVVFP